MQPAQARALVAKWCATTALVITIPQAACAAEDVASFYSGRTIMVTNPFENAGIYGQGAQVLANYLPRYLPGKPKAVVQSMPGAAGLRQANYMFNNAPRDGSVIGILYDTAPEAQRLDPEQVHFDASRFNALGSINQGDVGLVGVVKSSGAQSIQSARDTEFFLGATGTAAGQYVVPHIMNLVLGTKFKIIPSYKGVNEQFLAIEKGELQGMFTNYNAFQVNRPDWTREGRFVWLAQLSRDRVDQFADVPQLQTLPANQIDRDAFRFLSLSRAIGKVFIAPPDVPQERLDALRTAFDAVMRDEDVKDALAKMSIEHAPRNWRAAQEVLRETVEMPDNVIERVRSLIKTP